jgi:hypothetical protein
LCVFSQSDGEGDFASIEFVSLTVVCLALGSKTIKP